MHAHVCYIVAWGTKLNRVWKQKYISCQICQIKVKMTTWFLKENNSYMNIILGVKNKLQKVCSNFCSKTQCFVRVIFFYRRLIKKNYKITLENKEK
jgi:hypothetical protein